MKTRIYNMVNAWRKWLLTTLTFVLVVVVCILFYNLYTTFTLNKLLTASIEDLLSKQYFSSVVIENREFELKTNGVFVPPTMRLIDANAKEKQLHEIIKKPVLILKISDMHCNSCIKDMFENLISNSENTPQVPVIVWVKTKTIKYLKQFERYRQYNIYTYMLSEELDALIPEISHPYFFVIDCLSFRINSTFVPLKEDNAKTGKFLNCINNIYH